jgi:DNA invertase Pin-like site-specific DNA recombinase
MNFPSARTFKVIGDCRVSTIEQASEGMFLDAQESRIRAWCLAQGAELVEIIRAEGVSGTKLLGERPGGRRVAHFAGVPTS